MPHRLMPLSLVLLATTLALAPQPARADRAAPWPTLQGEAALAHLRREGLDGSLVEDLTATRDGARSTPGRLGDFTFHDPAQRLRARFDSRGLALESGTAPDLHRLTRRMRSLGGERQLPVGPGRSRRLASASSRRTRSMVVRRRPSASGSSTGAGPGTRLHLGGAPGRAAKRRAAAARPRPQGRAAGPPPSGGHVSPLEFLLTCSPSRQIDPVALPARCRATCSFQRSPTRERPPSARFRIQGVSPGGRTDRFLRPPAQLMTGWEAPVILGHLAIGVAAGTTLHGRCRHG
jgi:hypothetical protein